MDRLQKINLSLKLCQYNNMKAAMSSCFALTHPVQNLNRRRGKRSLILSLDLFHFEINFNCKVVKGVIRSWF